MSPSWQATTKPITGPRGGIDEVGSLQADRNPPRKPSLCEWHVNQKSSAWPCLGQSNWSGGHWPTSASRRMAVIPTVASIPQKQTSLGAEATGSFAPLPDLAIRWIECPKLRVVSEPPHQAISCFHPSQVSSSDIRCTHSVAGSKDGQERPTDLLIQCAAVGLPRPRRTVFRPGERDRRPHLPWPDRWPGIALRVAQIDR